MKIICPKCLEKNSTSEKGIGTRCAYCHYCFTIDDINFKADWHKGRESVKEVEIGTGVMDLSDQDFWGNNQSGEGFWGNYC